MSIWRSASRRDTLCARSGRWLTRFSPAPMPSSMRFTPITMLLWLSLLQYCGTSRALSQIQYRRNLGRARNSQAWDEFRKLGYWASGCATDALFGQCGSWISKSLPADQASGTTACCLHADFGLKWTVLSLRGPVHGAFREQYWDYNRDGLRQHHVNHLTSVCLHLKASQRTQCRWKSVNRLNENKGLTAN